MTRLPVGHTHNDLDARFGVFNFQVLPSAKKTNLRKDIVTPTQFTKKVEEIYTKNDNAAVFPGFDFVDLPHTFDFKSWLASHLKSPFPFKYKCTKAKDYSWDKLQMIFTRDFGTGKCYVRHAEPWPTSEFKPEGLGHEILVSLPDLQTGPTYAPFKKCTRAGKSARSGDEDLVAWTETTLAKAIRASLEECCNTSEEQQEWDTFFTTVPKTPEDVPEEKQLKWNWVPEDKIKYKNYSTAAGNVLYDLNNCPRNERLHCAGEELRENDQDNAAPAVEQEHVEEDAPEPVRLMIFFFYKHLFLIVYAIMVGVPAQMVAKRGDVAILERHGAGQPRRVPSIQVPHAAG